MNSKSDSAAACWGVEPPFQKGASANPGGRPVGLAAFVQRKCGRDDRKPIDALMAIAFVTDADRHALFGERVLYPPLKDRLADIDPLLIRGFGRPALANDDAAAPEPRSVIVIDLHRPRVCARRTGGGLWPVRQAGRGFFLWQAT
jgi:hypothetical protein